MKKIILFLSILLITSPSFAKKHRKRRRKHKKVTKPIIDKGARTEISNLKQTIAGFQTSIASNKKAMENMKNKMMASKEKMQKMMAKHKQIKSEMQNKIKKLEETNTKLLQNNQKITALTQKLNNRGSVLLPKGWTLKFGGFINFDTYYSTEEVFNLDSPAWAVQQSKSKGSALGFSARNTRLRMTFGAPNIGKLKTSGVLEWDFYGNLPASITSIRTSQFRMRLAYASLQYEDITVHLGNDWMIAAPQFETGGDPFNLWASGNLWMRIPQLKIMYNKKFNQFFKLEYGVTVGDSMGADGPKNTMIRSMGIGENSSMPVVQARLGLGFKLGKCKWSTIGISGSYQKLDFHGYDAITSSELATLESKGEDKIASYFVAADAKIKAKIANYKLQFTGEVHYGQALGMYWGGILQTYQFIKDTDGNISGVNPIHTFGYFADLKTTSPFGFALSLGVGQSVIDRDDLNFEANRRRKNLTLYATLTYKLGRMIFGLGGAKLTTDYSFTEDDGETWLVHAFSSFKF